MAEEFTAWAMQQEPGRYELARGEVVAMAPERVGHARVKGLILQCMFEAIAAAKLPCEVFPGSIGVRVDANTVYEPAVLVRCGASLDDDTVTITDPLIVVELVSRSSRGVDTGAKMVDYLCMPSVRHYLVVRTDRKVMVHHAKDEAGTVTTRIVPRGPLRLDPPGLDLQDVFD